MKAVLISIQPKHVANICTVVGNENGKPIYKKRIEVRKKRPKLETPFKCYIYMTQGKLQELGDYSEWIYQNRMKVIGEFVCDRIDEYTFSNLEADYRVNHNELGAMCLNYPELLEYGNGKPLYGWHISDLTIYDEPKDLGEFRRTIICKNNRECTMCENGIRKIVDRDCEFSILLTRPPQSWCYIEGLESKEI